MGIDKDKSFPACGVETQNSATLRRRAEDQVKAAMTEAGFSRTDDVTQRLLHELQVHQVELEMQNAELRQARDEMEKVLERYTDLYDFAPVGYFTLDRNGIIRTVNIAGACLTGGVRSRLIGKRFELFVVTTDRSAFTRFLGTVLTCPVKESCEVALVNDGKQPVIVQIEAMANASGQEFRLAMINISERRRTEEALAEKQRELKELNNHLELHIAQAVDEARKKDQMLILQDRMAIMGEMINNIAHQWRQPLNALGLVIQQVPVFYDTEEFNREFLAENTCRAMNLIQHMSRTIDDFRNFFRADKKAVSFGVSSLIKRTLSMIEENFKQQNIGIVLHSEGNPMAYGYPNEYSQVLLNILMNARDALVEHKINNAIISIHAFAEGTTSAVTITDNAGGIADEIMGRLFDPYFTTKGPDKGTGIGLFMSKTIIEKNMGGKLTVRNTGNGAEFRIEV